MQESSMHVLLREARFYQASGDLKKAEETYRKLALYKINEHDPLKLYCLINKARLFLAEKKYPDCIDTCEIARKICIKFYGPKDIANASILPLLGSAYEGLGSYDKAAQLYLTTLSYSNASPCSKNVVQLIPLMRIGDLEFKRKNFNQAMNYYQQATAITGTACTDMIYRLLNYRMALCSLSMHRKDMAEKFFRNALPYVSDNAAPMNIVDKFARFLEAEGKLKEATEKRLESKGWQAKHKEYADFQVERCNLSSRCVLMDRLTENDYYLVDSLNPALIVK